MHRIISQIASKLAIPLFNCNFLRAKLKENFQTVEMIGDSKDKFEK